MVTPLQKFAFVKRFRDARSKILLPDNVGADDTTMFTVEAVGPDVTNVKVGDVCIFFSTAVAQQIQGGYVCNSEQICAIIN